MYSVTERFNRTFADDAQERIFQAVGIWCLLTLATNILLVAGALVLSVSGSEELAKTFCLTSFICNMAFIAGPTAGGFLLIPIGLIKSLAEYLPTPDFLTYRYLRWKLRRMKKLQVDEEDVERKWDIRRLEAALYRELN